MDGEGLRVAFNALIETVDPARRDLVLRNAIVQLVGAAEVGSTSRPLSERSPSVSTGDVDSWLALKPRIRGELTLRAISMGVLAEESGLPRSTLEKVLSPKGMIPGRLVAEKLEGWLDRSARSKSPASASNGSAPAVATKPSSAAPAPNGHNRIGPLPPTKLDAAQTDRLLAYLAHTSERQIRDELEMTAN